MADIAYRHPPGIQADNHRIQAIEAPLSFTYQARGERACPVPGNLDLEGTHLRYHGLLRRAVPRVRARPGAGLALLIPQVLGQLGGQAALQGLLKQRGQQALTARHLDLASIKTLKQRIQRPRATQLLHRLTPTSARHNNIIIIHHASILSNKKTDTQTIEHAPSPAITPDLACPLRDPNSMSCLREVQTISKSPDILPLPSLRRFTTGGVLNPLKNTTNTGHNELLHQDPLQPPLEPRPNPAHASSTRAGQPTTQRTHDRHPVTMPRLTQVPTQVPTDTVAPPAIRRLRPSPTPPGSTLDTCTIPPCLPRSIAS